MMLASVGALVIVSASAVATAVSSHGVETATSVESSTVGAPDVTIVESSLADTAEASGSVEGQPAGESPTTYVSTSFVVPFEVTPPEWVAPEPAVELPNFVTWEGAEIDRGIRFLVPLNVYPPGETSPAPVPEDYLAYLLAQSDHGAVFEDIVETTVDSRPATVLTATTPNSLDGSIGCQEEDLTAAECFGVQPDLILHMAVIDSDDGPPLLIWVRDLYGASDRDIEYDSFDEMLASVHFRQTTASSAPPASTTPSDSEVTAASGTEAPAEAAGGRIAYSRALPDGGVDTYTVTADGGDEQQVAIPETNEDFGRAVWSHDGGQLLFSNIVRFDGDELLPFRPATARPDGSEFNLLELPDFPSDMYCTAWSPDDQQILCGVGGDSPGMWSLSASDGSDAVQLTMNPDGAQDNPVGNSADGTQIAFLRFRPSGTVALFVANADGTDPRQVTEFGVLLGHELASAAWSPDGEHLISATAGGDLVEVRSDGSGTEIIDLDMGTDDYFAFAPSYSPDGNRIVFSLEVGAAADIYSADPDGSNVVQITDTDNPERYPNWTNTTATEKPVQAGSRRTPDR